MFIVRNKFYLAWWIYLAIFVPIGVVVVISITLVSLWKRNEINKIDEEEMKHKGKGKELNKGLEEKIKENAVNYVLFVQKPVSADISFSHDNNGENNYEYIPIELCSGFGITSVIKNKTFKELENDILNILNRKISLTWNGYQALQNQYEQIKFLYAQADKDNNIIFGDNKQPEIKEYIAFNKNEKTLNCQPIGGDKNHIKYTLYSDNGKNKKFSVSTEHKTEDNIEYLDEFSTNGVNVRGTSVITNRWNEGVYDTLTRVNESIEENINDIKYRTGNGVKDVTIKAKYKNDIPYGKGRIGFFDNEGLYNERDVIFSGQKMTFTDNNKKQGCVFFYTDPKDNIKYCFNTLKCEKKDVETLQKKDLGQIEDIKYIDLENYNEERRVIDIKDGKMTCLKKKGTGKIQIDLQTPSKIESDIIAEKKEKEMREINNKEADISNVQQVGQSH